MEGEEGYVCLREPLFGLGTFTRDHMSRPVARLFVLNKEKGTVLKVSTWQRVRGNTGNGEMATTCTVAIVMLAGQSGAGQRVHEGHSGGRMCSISRLQRVLSLHLPGGLHFDPPGSTLLLLLVCHQSRLLVVRNGVLC